MQHTFRDHHILTIMEAYDEQSLPLDLFVGNYFRSNKALGSKDRSAIAETVYAMIRWRGLLDHLSDKPIDWQKRLKIFSDPSFSSHKNRTDLENYIRVSFPKVLFDHLVECYGEEKAYQICVISNTAAPTTVRINTIKTTREEMLANFEKEFGAIPCKFSACGITFPKRIQFSQMPEFKQGFFEIQDEGSQLLAELVDVKPGQLILDYCAGAGGKTLAFAPKMKGTGQIYLHDIRKHALEDGKKRMRRAGIQNAQIVHSDDEAKLKKLKKNMDLVLVDAPCTGTGTMRRNPDMKWTYSEAMLERLIGQQRTIFERALSFLKPTGQIIYATCSLLKQENSDQIAHFIKTYDLESVGNAFESIPMIHGMDGFFGAVLRRKQSS